jgi:hypothetical protein
LDGKVKIKLFRCLPAASYFAVYELIVFIQILEAASALASGKNRRNTVRVGGGGLFRNIGTAGRTGESYQDSTGLCVVEKGTEFKSAKYNVDKSFISFACIF